MNLTQCGTVAGALAAICGTAWGGLTFASPYLETKPPFASVEQVKQLAQNYQQQQMNLQQMQQNQLFLAQGFWTNQLTLAQAELRRNPNNIAARQQELTAQQALNGIQQQLFGVRR